MGNWGSHAFTQNDYNRIADLLSPKAKQAVLAAVSKFGTLRKGTWDGCVFNAAGKIEGVEVRNFNSAAETFDMTASNVSRFIRTWDKMMEGDHRATMRLQQALERDPEALTGKSKEVTVVIHESEETRMQQEFESMVADLDIPMDKRSADQQEFADSVSNAAELLFA